MPVILQSPELVEGKAKRLDNQRIFRPEAVEAYSTRRAGEPWESCPRFERWIVSGLTILTLAGAAAMWLGGR
jgi:hypothetical protein